jgi:hypothetical protein
VLLACSWAEDTTTGAQLLTISDYFEIGRKPRYDEHINLGKGKVMKEIFGGIRKYVLLSVVGLSCFFGVMGISVFTVDRLYDTEWTVNEDYNPNATLKYTTVCGYSYGYGEQCDSVAVNEVELASGYYHSFGAYQFNEDEYYGYGDHKSFLGNTVPANPFLFFLLLYSVLFWFGVKRIVKQIEELVRGKYDYALVS